MKRTALVTGGNRGISLAIIRQLAELGNAVLLGARDLQAGEEAAAPLRGRRLEMSPIRLDLTNVGTADAAIRDIEKSGQAIDVLVNSAGVLHEKPLLELTDGETAESLAVHFTRPIRLIRALVPGMSARGYGGIVNRSSGWGSFAEGLGGHGGYGVTKAARNALTARLARELPPTISVNARCPGWVQTRAGGQASAKTTDEGADTSVWLATLLTNGPTGGYFRDRRPINC